MQTNKKTHSCRQFITRKEVFQITGIAVTTLATMAHEKRGPVCRIPEGYSQNVYVLNDVEGWMVGKTIPPWSGVDIPICSRRGANLRKQRRSGRPRKQPKTQIETNENEGGKL